MITQKAEGDINCFIDFVWEINQIVLFIHLENKSSKFKWKIQMVVVQSMRSKRVENILSKFEIKIHANDRKWIDSSVISSIIAK